MHPLTKRSFLGLLGGTAVSTLLPRRLHGSDAPIRISLLHTTDLHGHILPTSTYEGEADVGGFARCAAQIRRWKEENPNWVLVDAGDVYQGTDVGWRTRGRIMTDCFNALNYDAWTIGNHEFDWGIEPLEETVQSSAMPVLSANARVNDAGGALSRIRPWILKEVAGLKIGVVGLTTPGLPYWFLPRFTNGFEARDPAAAAAAAFAELEAAGADAIIISAHMGSRPQGDDFANQLEAVARTVPKAAVIVAGHTHRDIPSSQVGGIPYTQANYFGINVGKTDLVFDAGSRHLLGVEPATLRMGPGLPQDPAVLSLAARDIEASEEILNTQAGVLNETLPADSAPGVPTAVERLIATAIFEALSERGVQADAVLHGAFSKEPLVAGPKSIRDLWAVLPYENYVVTGLLSAEELTAVMQEIFGSRRRAERSLAGMRVKLEESGNPPRVALIEDLEGRPLARGKRWRIAMNTFDAAGGGQRLMRLREIMASGPASAEIQPVQTREALISYFSSKGSSGVSLADLRAA